MGPSEKTASPSSMPCSGYSMPCASPTSGAPVTPAVQWKTTRETNLEKISVHGWEQLREVPELVRCAGVGAAVERSPHLLEPDDVRVCLLDLIELERLIRTAHEVAQQGAHLGCQQLFAHAPRVALLIAVLLVPDVVCDHSDAITALILGGCNYYDHYCGPCEPENRETKA